MRKNYETMFTLKTEQKQYAPADFNFLKIMTTDE